jgi:hypothetical protein
LDRSVGSDRLQPLARVYFAVVGVIGVLTGAVLLAAPANTAEYFVWPVEPPATVIFMGAGYLGTGITLLILLFRARTWTDARLILPPIGVFALAMLGATMIHADRFLWNRPVTWLWAVLYCVILVGVGLLMRIHRHARSSRRPEPLTRGECIALIVVGVAVAAWAVPLYAQPALGSILWPWAMGALSMRVVAGWISVAAVLGIIGGLVGDSRSLRLPLLGWAITVAAFLVAALFTVPLHDVRAVVYFTGLGVSLVGSIWLLVRIQRRLRL